MKLTLTPATNKTAWDVFVRESSEGSVFCRVPFLDAVEQAHELWWVEEDGRPRLGAIVLTDRVGEPQCVPVGFGLYQGILLDRAHADLEPHTRVKAGLELATFLLDELEQRYRRISLCLHPCFLDARALSWFHYHEPAKGRFTLDVAYTGWIDLRGEDFETYLSTVRDVRRYEYRRALREGFTAEPSTDFDTLERLYRLTFGRQGIEPDDVDLRQLRTLAQAATSQGFGEMLLARSPAGEPASATLFLHDERAGYYLVGANDPAYRQSGSGAFVVLESIRRCFERVLERVDVCGINSPNRGDFKTSLNAVPVPYLVANWERPVTGGAPSGKDDRAH